MPIIIMSLIKIITKVIDFFFLFIFYATNVCKNGNLNFTYAWDNMMMHDEFSLMFILSVSCNIIIYYIFIAKNRRIIINVVLVE